MSAAPIHPATRSPRVPFSSRTDPDVGPISDLSAYRDSWLTRGICTRPADRTIAESAVAQLYRLSGCPEPEFVWTPSPPAAQEVMTAMGRSDVVSISTDSLESAPARIAHLLSASRTRMDAKIMGAHRSAWGERHMTTIPGVPSQQMSHDAQIDSYRFVRTAIWDSLRSSLCDGVAAAIRTLMPPFLGAVTWYGQQEAHRVAYYDYYRRSGLAVFRRCDVDLLDVLATLTGATGWWWAFDDVCVMAERPTAVHTEPLPNGAHDQQRPHRDDAPAIEFPDGNEVFAHHGTIIPAWVVREPTVERIARERNVEVRRCAIERIGWDTYIDAAGLEQVDHTVDPGNGGNPLALYATPVGWGRPERILLVVNGSVERDGQRRRYGLRVPPWIGSALDAAGWTYGIRGSEYAQLARRT